MLPVPSLLRLSLSVILTAALLLPCPSLAQPAPDDPEEDAPGHVPPPPPPPPDEIPVEEAPAPAVETPAPRPPAPAAPAPRKEPAPLSPVPEAPKKAEEPPSFFEQVLSSIQFHGYARMPLNMYLGDASEETGGGTDGPRTPNLVDNDYYRSGFAYLRIHETDWAELFLSASSHEVTLTLGMFASLFSDSGEMRLDTQWGIAQASLAWEHKFQNPYFKRLLIQAGAFWNRLGFIDAYDTYVFGRTHQMGIKVEAEFPWVEVGFGFGAHLGLTSQKQGFTPLIYGHALIKPPWPVTLGFYVLHEWSNDKPPLAQMEDAKMTTLGFEIKVDVPYLRGPLQIIPWAYYTMENAVFLTEAIEVLHSTGGKGLMDNFLGDRQGSDQGDGSFPYVGAIDFPATIWAGRPSWPILSGAMRLRLFGMLAYVKSPQDFPDDPSKNRNKRTYLKWGFEPQIGVFPWLHLGLIFNRVVMDLYDGENSFRAITPRLTFQVFKWGSIYMQYTRYSYGDKVSLRAGQVQGSISLPDEDIFKIQATAVW